MSKKLVLDYEIAAGEVFNGIKLTDVVDYFKNNHGDPSNAVFHHEWESGELVIKVFREETNSEYKQRVKYERTVNRKKIYDLITEIRNLSAEDREKIIKSISCSRE